MRQKDNDFGNPICVAFWSWLIWGKLLTYHYWLSAAIVLCGQLLFYASIQRKAESV